MFIVFAADIYAKCSETQTKEYSNRTAKKNGTRKRSKKETVETATSPKGSETLKPLEGYCT